MGSSKSGLETTMNISNKTFPSAYSRHWETAPIVWSVKVMADKILQFWIVKTHSKLKAKVIRVSAAQVNNALKVFMKKKEKRQQIKLIVVYT